MSPEHANLGFSYDDRGRRTEISRPNGVTSAAVIDAANQLQTLVHQLDSAPGPFTQFDYTYDGAGNRTQRAQTREVPEVKTALNYVYDAKEQLVQATRPFLGEPDETYNYDPVGNRLNRDGQSGDSIFDAANRLLEDGEFCYAYDANGNLVSKQAKLSGSCSGTLTEYRYNPEDQLMEVIVDGTTSAEYAYDGLGRRIQKVTPAGTTRYIYDGQDIYLKYDGSDTLIARYTHGLNIDEPLIMERDLDANGAFEASERFYYHTDALGSITELTNSTGDVAQAYVYDSFGNTVVTDGMGVPIGASTGITNPFAFTAREFDQETGLYYYRTRYYDTTNGIFIQEDPLGSVADAEFFSSEGAHLYQYVRNNPTRFIDPTGKFLFPVVPILSRIILRTTVTYGAALLEFVVHALEASRERAEAKREIEEIAQEIESRNRIRSRLSPDECEYVIDSGGRISKICGTPGGPMKCTIEDVNGDGFNDSGQGRNRPQSSVDPNQQIGNSFNK